MEKYYYDVSYLQSLTQEQLVNMMDEHGYESGYEEFEKSELIEVLSNILES